MKILITGGAGFIGSHLADKLIDRGDKVVVVDNLATGRKENVNSKVIFYKLDISNDNQLGEIFSEHRPETVIHAAASYKSPDDWREDVKTNVLGTVNVLKHSKETDVRRLIYFQTSLCYGLNPIEQPITLNHPLFEGKYKGGSSYAITKTAGELFISMSGLNFISFRLANAYGPRNLSGPLPTFYKRLMSGEECFVADTRRDFIYIDDLIAVVIKAISMTEKSGFYHVSSGKDYSIKELYDTLSTFLDDSIKQRAVLKPRSPDDTYTILLDPKKTEDDFDWQVHTPLEEGIKSAVEWYRKNRIENTYTHLKR